MMTAFDINKHLNRLFANYEYKLQNSFVFNWECDFFCMSKSGYFVEVEIKVSRSDFFKDFEKGKHKIFRDLVAGKKISAYKTGYNNRGDIAVKNFPQVEISCRGYRSSYARNHI